MIKERALQLMLESLKFKEEKFCLDHIFEILYENLTEIVKFCGLGAIFSMHVGYVGSCG